MTGILIQTAKGTDVLHGGIYPCCTCVDPSRTHALQIARNWQRNACHPAPPVGMRGVNGLARWSSADHDRSDQRSWVCGAPTEAHSYSLALPPVISLRNPWA